MLTWKKFVEALCTRFDSSLHEDYEEELAKLQQKNSFVQEYKSQFEQLANSTTRLTEEFFEFFISSLKDKLKYDVQMFRPTTMTDAISLARLHEECLLALG